MNCEPLSNTFTHHAWQQRVSKEHGNAHRFNTNADYLPIRDQRRESGNHWLAAAPGASMVGKTQA